MDTCFALFFKCLSLQYKNIATQSSKIAHTEINKPETAEITQKTCLQSLYNNRSIKLAFVKLYIEDYMYMEDNWTRYILLQNNTTQ